MLNQEVITEFFSDFLEGRGDSPRVDKRFGRCELEPLNRDINFVCTLRSIRSCSINKPVSIAEINCLTLQPVEQEAKLLLGYPTVLSHSLW